MSISGIGSWLTTSPSCPASASDATSSSVPDTQSLRRPQQSQFRSDFASLLDAVKSGDMSAAQLALTAVQNDRASANATYSSQSTQSSSPISTDIQSLFDAVQKGDTTGAQQALTQLQTDAKQNAPQGLHGHGHHHHHHSQSVDPTSTATDSTGTSTTDGTVLATS